MNQQKGDIDKNGLNGNDLWGSEQKRSKES